MECWDGLFGQDFDRCIYSDEHTMLFKGVEKIVLRELFFLGNYFFWRRNFGTILYLLSIFNSKYTPKIKLSYLKVMCAKKNINAEKKNLR